MKNQILSTALLAILLTSPLAFSADLRDASLGASTNVSDIALDQTGKGMDASKKVYDLTSAKIQGLAVEAIKKAGALSTQGSEITYNALKHLDKIFIPVTEFSAPIFKITQDGLVVVFEQSMKAASKGTEVSSDVSEKLILILEPASEMSSDVISEIFKLLSKGTEASSDVTESLVKFIAENSEKPLELTGNVLKEVFKLISEGSEASSKITDAVVGGENIEAAFEISGKGISLTSKGIFRVFDLISKSTSAVTNLFVENAEEIENAMERDDEQFMAGLRAELRAHIDYQIKNGNELNKLLTDEHLDAYIEAVISAE